MRFVITLTDEEFATLSDRSKCLTETLVTSLQMDNIEVIVQREAAGEESEEDTVDTPEDNR